MMRSLSLRVSTNFHARMAIPDHLGVCREPHGYRFALHATVSGVATLEKPWLADLVEIEHILASEITTMLDGRNLNELIRYPSLEGILVWCLNKLQQKLPDLSRLELEAPPRYAVLWERPVHHSPTPDGTQ